MISIFDFITARLDEDEKAAQETTGIHWTWDRIGETFHVHSGAWDVATIHAGPIAPETLEERRACERSHAVHIARHDPARVKREVFIKRAILAGVRELVNDPEVNNDAAKHLLAHVMLRSVIEPMAFAWSDHPDYDTEWSMP